jgi:protein-disulfide isomerase
MTFRFRGASAAAAILLLGTQAWVFAEESRKIAVGDDPSLKQGSPALVLVELSDYQCAYCGAAARELIPKVQENFVRTGKVELIFVDLPLDMHPHAFKAAEAAACAGEQKKFWEMHDRLFANQAELAPEKLPGHAEKLGLDVAAFTQCLASGSEAAGIEEDLRAAQALSLSSTPSYLIGRRLPGGDKVEVFQAIRGLPPYEYLEGRLNGYLAAEPPK